MRFLKLDDWDKISYKQKGKLPSKRPGTSPFASNVFILSKNDESKIFDSSIINAIFSLRQPDLLRTILKSSSKSSAVYFLCT